MNVLLSDSQWEKIAPLLPPPAKTGRPRADDRRTVEAIIYILRVGCRWRDLPQQYGSPITAWRRLRRWQSEGVWERLWRSFTNALARAEQLDLGVCSLDGSFVSAKKGARR